MTEPTALPLLDRWSLARRLDTAAWLLDAGGRKGQVEAVPLSYLTHEEVLEWGRLAYETQEARQWGRGDAAILACERRLLACEATLADEGTARVEATIPGLLAVLQVPAGAHGTVVAALHQLAQKLWQEQEEAEISAPWDTILRVLQTLAAHREGDDEALARASLPGQSSLVEALAAASSPLCGARGERSDDAE